MKNRIILAAVAFLPLLLVTAVFVDWGQIFDLGEPMPSEEHAKECLEKKLDGEGEPVSVVSLRKTGGSGSDVPGFLPGLRQKVYIMNCEAVLEFTKDGRCRTIRGTGWGAERGAVDGKKGQRTTVGGELSFFKVNGAWDARQLINLSVIDTKAKDDHR